MKDNLYLGDDAREKVMLGVKKIAQAVGQTMGTAGKNAVVETLEHPGTSTTNDGATIVDKILLADPLEEMGRKILREAVSRANKASGDGSSTTCVLTSSILEEGLKHLENASVMEVKKSLEDCIPVIEEGLKAQKREITVDSVKDVATISAEDEKMGEMIQEIYQKIGKDGVIQWDISRTPDDHYEIGNGITVAQMTCPTPFMYDRDPNTGYFTNYIRRTNPRILLSRQKISTIHDLNHLGESLSKEEVREVIVVCEEVERQAIEESAAAWQQFKVIFVKMPPLWADEWWEDLAAATGASVIGQGGSKLSKAGIQDTGTCEKLTIGKEETIFEGINDLSRHIESLQEDGVGDLKLSDEQREKNKLRASRLSVKTARYYVGGYSEQSIYHRRLKLEDALNSAKCALEDGVLPGGGKALINVISKLPGTIGGKILKNSLVKPLGHIASNAGIYDVDLSKTKETEGLDSRTGKIVDMFEAKIVDAYDVVLNAVKSSVGVAATILTLGSVVLLPRKDEDG